MTSRSRFRPSQARPTWACLFAKVQDPALRKQWLDDLGRIAPVNSPRSYEIAAYHHLALGDMERVCEYAARALAGRRTFLSGRTEANLLWMRGDTEAALARLVVPPFPF